MFAVLCTGGKQYKVSEGDVIQVEKLKKNIGDRFDFAEILMAGEGEQVEVGTPYLTNFKVNCEVTDQMKGPKIIVFKKRRRKNYRRKNGHRQQLTKLKITGISKE